LTQKAVGSHFGDLIVVFGLKEHAIEDLEGKKTAVVLRGFKCRSRRKMKSEGERSGTFDSTFYLIVANYQRSTFSTDYLSTIVLFCSLVLSTGS
jgi:hypothetical protein